MSWKVIVKVMYRKHLQNLSRSLSKTKDPTSSIVVIRVNFFQTELMVEICSESLVRAIGKVLLMKFSEKTN